MHAPHHSAQELLKSRQLRQTLIRTKVLDVFLNRPDAIAQHDLEEILGPVDRITLYRTLRTFEESGIIHRALDGTGKMKFALCQSGCSHTEHLDEHAHLYCERCHRTLCLEDIKTPQVQGASGFQVKASYLALQGLCPECAAAQAKAEPDPVET